jgi:hypothetical protein
MSDKIFFWLGVIAHTCHSSSGGKLKIGESWSRPVWEKSKTLSPKQTTAKRAGGVVQAVEYLLLKCKALSSNRSTTKKYIYLYFLIKYIYLHVIDFEIVSVNILC